MLSHHRFDPELAAALCMMPEVDITDVEAARAAQAEQLAAVVAAADTAGVDVKEVSVPGPDSAPAVRLRIYRPDGGLGPLPAVYSMHGGGFILGSPDVDHDWNLLLCRELEALVVSVDYRLAPEHPFPAPLEDCYAGLRWLAENADDLGVLPDRIALWGDSAGAGPAAALSLLARDRGGPAEDQFVERSRRAGALQPDPSGWFQVHPAGDLLGPAQQGGAVRSEPRRAPVGQFQARRAPGKTGGGPRQGHRVEAAAEQRLEVGDHAYGGGGVRVQRRQPQQQSLHSRSPGRTGT